MQAEIYSTLKQEKSHIRSLHPLGNPEGKPSGRREAIGEVVKAWTTEGHSVALPGVGTMRFGLQAAAVSKVEDVGMGLITTRKVIFTPSTTIKQELKDTSINITCYDKDGKVIKQVTSSDPGNVDDEGGTDNPGGADWTKIPSG